MTVDNKPVTIVGVAQPAPTFPQRMDALLNMVISEHHTSAMMVQGRTHRMTEMIARLAPGATVEQARAEIKTIRERVQKRISGSVRQEFGLQGHGDAVPGSARRESAAHAVAAHGRGGVRDDHLVRQRREPDADARRAARAGARGARGARRGRGATATLAARREPRAGVRRRRARAHHRDRRREAARRAGRSAIRRAPTRSGSTAWCSGSRCS